MENELEDLISFFLIEMTIERLKKENAKFINDIRKIKAN
jgi:hypothetical protein